MDGLLQDLRFALRVLRSNPLFTAAAVLTLALGIGLNTAVFSAVHALLLRPLPGVREPDRLVQLYRSYPGGFDYGTNSIPHFRDVRERNTAFEDVAAWSYVPLSVSADGRNERVFAQMVSANFFSVLGVDAVRGRTFTADEDEGWGAHPVVVLSHATWRGRFGGDPGIVGREILVNGRPFTVVGVAPAEFTGALPVLAPALWAPLTMQRELLPNTDLIERRGSNFLNVIARLRPGVTPARAAQAMDALIAALREEHPAEYEDSGITLVPQEEAGIHPGFGRTQRTLPAVLMALVGVLLLIACVNVANLFLARAESRRREIGIRLSLGARRGRVVRQLLTESLVLSLLAGGAGIILAYWANRVLSGIRLPFDVDTTWNLELSLPVLVFALAASVLTGAAFGLVPALQASRPELVSTLRAGSARGGTARWRASHVLVAVQVALALPLLVAAGLFVRNLREATTLDRGFAAENLLLAGVDPGLQGYDRARAEQFYRDALARIRALPGVEAASAARIVPLGLINQQSGVSVPGYEPGPNENTSINYNVVAPGYFETLGVPLVAGRTFTERDERAAPGVIVVNQRFAERFWPGQDPIGKTVHVAGMDRQVIGVVATGKYRSLGEAPLEYVYLPQAQAFEFPMVFHVRTAGDPAAIAGPLRAAIRALDPNLPVYEVQTMDEHLGIALLPARLAGIGLGLFGLLGMALAAVGIYGVMAYAVAQRTREIGIRIALGAANVQVVRMVLRQALRIVLPGAALGLAGALLTARLVRGLLYTPSGADPVSFLLVPLFLVAVALFASYLPARRAAQVDPLHALRME